jgi:glycosyltransferase involved in cell wall biosynthesis
VRIAWFVYGEVTQPTGGYVYDRLVLEGLRRRGHRVEVVDLLRASQAPPEAEVLVGDALCVRELGPLFEGSRARARVLLVHHFPSWEVERDDRGAMRALERRALAASDFAVATGHATRVRLLAEGAALPVHVVPPGADRLPRVARAPEEGVAVVFVGSLVRRKRVDLLLDAVERTPGLRLTLIGDPAREPQTGAELLARAAALGRVTAAGVVGEGELAARLARADALVLPSSLEGYGMAMTEALHAGLPVIAARGAAEAAGIAHLDAVRVFDDADGLAKLLRRFASDAGLRASMRAAAEAVVLPRWEDAVTAFAGALRLGGEG